MRRIYVLLPTEDSCRLVVEELEASGIPASHLHVVAGLIHDLRDLPGASIWQRFRQITFPLLLVAVGPLLLASYVHNFNNFNLMFLLGGPPILGSPTPANQTDILISYVYRLAFEGGRGQDYGLASAITILILFL